MSALAELLGATCFLLRRQATAFDDADLDRRRCDEGDGGEVKDAFILDVVVAM